MRSERLRLWAEIHEHFARGTQSAVDVALADWLMQPWHVRLREWVRP